MLSFQYFFLMNKNLVEGDQKYVKSLELQHIFSNTKNSNLYFLSSKLILTPGNIQ